MWLLRFLRAGAILVPIVPARLGYGLCRLIGLIFFVANVRARRHVLDNLRHVEPRAGWVRREIDAARAFITVVTNYYDLIRLRSVDRERVAELFEVRGWENFYTGRRRQHGVIILSAHVGNFSVVASYPAALGYHAAVIAERVEPPALFRYMTRLRSVLGIDVIPPGSEAIRRILRLLRHNHVLLVACDRNVAGRALPVELFGAPALLPVGPVLLAMRTGAALLPTYTHRLTNRRSVVYIAPPLKLQDTGDWDADLAANMRLMAGALEAMIKADPGQWGVLQPIWEPKSRDTAAFDSRSRHEDARVEPSDLAGIVAVNGRRRLLHRLSRRSLTPRRPRDSDSLDRPGTAGDARRSRPRT